MNILLVRLRLIGDVVFTTPAIRAIRERFPAARLTYIIEPAAAPVVIDNPNLDDVVVAPRRRGIGQFAADVALGLALRRRHFDVAIDFHGGPRSSLLTLLSGARRRIGYTTAGRAWMYTERVERPRELRPRHSVENQWDLLRPLGIADPDRSRNPVEMITNPDAAARAAERLASAGVLPGDTVIVMHVSAGNAFRRWPIGSFATVAATLASDARARVVVTSGPSEITAASCVVDAARAQLGPAIRTSVIDAGDLPLADLRALLDRAALYIGGDSGPLHVAATSHVPVVGLYGPTLPVRSGPWRSRDDIHEAVEVPELPCRPCDQRVCAPGDFRCLTRITPDDVIAAARRALARNRH